MNNKHGYWIHAKRKSDDAVKGYFFERECTCSICGKLSNMEKDKCVYCGAIMDQVAPKSEN